MKDQPDYLKNQGEIAKDKYEEYTLFRGNLMVLRTSQKLSPEYLGVFLELKSKKRIYDLECGRCPPTFDEIKKIAKFFKVTIDNLLYEKAAITITFEQDIPF